MLSIRHAVLLPCAAALMACADAAGPVGPPSPSASLLPDITTEFLPGIPVLDPFAEPLDGGGVLESARGGGHITFMDARRTFAFTAKNKSDATTQGQFQLNNRAAGFFKEHGVVTCLVVDGNEAVVGGYVTHSEGGTEGMWRVWRVTDNGEGSNNPPDRITSFGVVGAEGICETVELEQPVEDGNIQVKDGPANGGDPT